MRRTVPMFVFTCLALGLAACGSQEPGDGQPSAQPTELSTPAEVTTTSFEPSDTAEPAPTASPTTEEYNVASRELNNADAKPVAGSCLAEIGREKAEALSGQCNQISTATRPPCNIQNSCERIRAEIKRGCAFGDGADNPAFCSEQEAR
ncbi:hypothetical protein MKP08_08215 [Erythrobacter sp. LQ02-29]|uniref:hypothetical protein n=1 Tax=Erythrobacter sp. LQ02-29 TaxID=2920384 RepID=UPI001F4E2D9F|nr:hypothetical protein [Erythrobacter sp. LQ02-29]MCP9222727.1 hypothetical protein [Erythrobacter sp. LQ02-29]